LIISTALREENPGKENRNGDVVQREKLLGPVLRYSDQITVDHTFIGRKTSDGSTKRWWDDQCGVSVTSKDWMRGKKSPKLFRTRNCTRYLGSYNIEWWLFKWKARVTSTEAGNLRNKKTVAGASRRKRTKRIIFGFRKETEEKKRCRERKEGGKQVMRIARAGTRPGYGTHNIKNLGKARAERLWEQGRSTERQKRRAP